MLLDTDRDRNIDFIGKKVSIFCQTHMAVGHRIQGGSPAAFLNKYAVAGPETAAVGPGKN